MQVSVGMEEKRLCAVLDLVTDSVGMGNDPFEREGEGEPLFFLLIFG